MKGGWGFVVMGRAIGLVAAAGPGLRRFGGGGVFFPGEPAKVTLERQAQSQLVWFQGTGVAFQSLQQGRRAFTELGKMLLGEAGLFGKRLLEVVRDEGNEQKFDHQVEDGALVAQAVADSEKAQQEDRQQEQEPTSADPFDSSFGEMPATAQNPGLDLVQCLPNLGLVREGFEGGGAVALLQNQCFQRMIGVGALAILLNLGRFAHFVELDHSRSFQFAQNNRQNVGFTLADISEMVGRDGASIALRSEEFQTPDLSEGIEHREGYGDPVKEQELGTGNHPHANGPSRSSNPSLA